MHNSTHTTAGASGVPAEHSVKPTEFISFAVGDVQYGVDIVAVREIKEWSRVTRLPDQPDYMRGVLNLRGIVVPIVDLRCRFGQGITGDSTSHIIIVVQIGDRQVGLLADRVLDIVSFDPAQVQPVPKVGPSATAGFLSGIVSLDGALITLVDLDKLLPDGLLHDASPRSPQMAEHRA